MTIVKIEADGQEGLNTIGKSSSDYEPSDNELARKYNQLASLLQNDKVRIKLPRRIRIVLEANPELRRRIRIILEANPEPKRIRIVLEANSEPKRRIRIILEVNPELRKRIRIILEANPESKRIRIILEANPEPKRIRVVLEANLELEKIRIVPEVKLELGKVRVILKVKPELGKVRVVLEAKLELRRIRVILEVKSELERIRIVLELNQLIFKMPLGIPTEEQLKLDETFNSQQNLVNNTIVPTIIKTLDLDIYPISEAIVYDMIHNRHKHQREEFLKKQKETFFQDEQARRKHMNSRRNDIKIDDPLVKMFKIKELLPIKSNSLYHSPEILETNDENPGQKKIVTRDLKWRSSTLRYFLRDYIDRIFSKSSKVLKKRTQIHNSINFYDKERTKLFQAPNWTISGYTSSLKTAVQKACMERSSNTLPVRV
ncbi:hypothetical protein C1646_790926 [Rhizophagus diaphanus]|nr:hypothetical protein C1646_790926 [Rhizophagus diaphanus] [Rhizophagus sp. MUCL 43196]